MTAPSPPRVTVIGGGLAGCECAFQVAERGIPVVLVEQRPVASSPVHEGDHLAQLVCSNSLRGASVENAVGLLKEEMRRAGSVIMRVADRTRVPAGGALAVDREQFSASITDIISKHPRIDLVRDVCPRVPSSRPCVIATGPLTSDALAADIARIVGASALAYYDAIAPIVDAESIDWNKVFRQSRFDKGNSEDPAEASAYVNCPFDKAEYFEFVRALVEAEKVKPHGAEEKIPYFEGCLPVEVMAERGPMTLSFGPMKPIGLTDPRTGRRPYAVVQLRPENREETAFNIVGFQTRMTHDAQRRVLRLIPGLEQAKFMRLGAIHRNTFVDAPKVLDDRLGLRDHDGLHLAGQITGVEGYVESSACGLVCGLFVADAVQGLPVELPPRTTALGALLSHLTRTDQPFQPSNITWAHFPPPPTSMHKRDKRAFLGERALCDLDAWLKARDSRA